MKTAAVCFSKELLQHLHELKESMGHATEDILLSMKQFKRRLSNAVIATGFLLYCTEYYYYLRCVVSVIGLVVVDSAHK
jgi:hypothetical protein